MDWATIQAHWDTFGPQLLDRWGRLTDEDIRAARAGRDDLVHRILKCYRIEPELARRHVDDWIKSASAPASSHDPAMSMPAVSEQSIPAVSH
ncbi:MAG: hypothetical protein IPG56_10415 [Caulobacteraceae bacterium]|nr:hypothetical protein [Caulobacteraceae bacterium]